MAKYIKYKIIIPVIFLLSFLFANCDFINMQSCSVIEYFPNQEANASVSEIQIHFSTAMAKETILTALTVEENSLAISGEYYWDSNNYVRFVPHNSFESGKLYHIEIGTGCESIYGNNIIAKIEQNFFIGTEKVKPSVIEESCFPANDSRMNSNDLTFDIVIEFSEYMDTSFVENNLSISPQTNGFYLWVDSNDVEVTSDQANDCKRLIFRPQTEYERGLKYTVVVNTTFRDLEHNPLLEAYSFSFYTKDTFTAPQLLNVRAISDASPDFTMNLPFSTLGSSVTEGIRGDAKLEFTFDRDMDFDTVKTNLEIEDETVTVEKISNMVFTAETDGNFIYDKSYRFIAKGTITDLDGNGLGDILYGYFKCDLEQFKPPQLIEIAYSGDDFDNSADITDIKSQIESNGMLFLINVNTEGWLSDSSTDRTMFYDIYFDSYHELDYLSVVNNISIEKVNIATGSQMSILEVALIESGDIDYRSAYKGVRVFVLIDGFAPDPLFKFTITGGSSGISDIENQYFETHYEFFIKLLLI